MGRYSTGVAVTDNILRIDIRQLVRIGTIVKGYSKSGTLSWTKGSGEKSSVHYESYYIGDIRCLNLSYTHTDYYTGQKVHHEERIVLDAIPSNLGEGKGEVLYFLCPESWNRCRILYYAYGSNVFKCRKAYRQRIYYPQQISSKNLRFLKRVFAVEDRLEELYKLRETNYYRGRLTRRRKRINRLIQKQQEAEYMSLTTGLTAIMGFSPMEAL